MTTGKNASIYRQDWSCLLCWDFVLIFQVSPLFITMDGVDNFHAPTQFNIFFYLAFETRFIMTVSAA